MALLGDLNQPRGNAMVAQQPACFDFPGSARPSHFHYTAPWHSLRRENPVSFPWDKLDGRPLVYTSMGTLQNKLRHVYRAIAEAARGLDIQMVLALGDQESRWDIPLPENVLAVGFAPQLSLLDRATAVVTHAGLNTTLESLARGLPMLCLPVTNDQPGIARRVDYLGAGLVLSLRAAKPDRIRSALVRLIQDAEFRSAACRARDRFAHLNGPVMAADIIERSTSTVQQIRMSTH